jgi:murein DD-endopeptidase MepM/ murein hydrolase activator NlpD
MKFNHYLTKQVFLSLILLVILLSTTTAIGFAANNFQEGPVYIIQQGDSLNSIALRFGVSPDELAAANNISDPNALFIGQQLVIPGLEGIKGVLVAEVLPFGYSLTGLIRQYGLKLEDLVFLNRLASPSEMIAGLKFIIPLDEGQTPLSPLASAEHDSTLIEIAIRSASSPWHLTDENQLTGTWDIIPGETLFSEPGNDESENSSFPSPIINIALNALPVIQGETLHISIATSEPGEFSGSFDLQPLRFFTEEEELYYAFHGIHALADPGPVSLEISGNFSDGRSFNFNQLVMLAEGGYIDQWVFVDEEYLDESRIAEENAYLQPILEVATSQKHWDGIFQSPVSVPSCGFDDFGLRRDYNDGGLSFYHTGIDFPISCLENLDIYAPADGEVVLAEELFIKGGAILIDHGWGVFSVYVHLSEFNVEAGDFVKAGDLLGLIGNTGRSAGYHLHFEIVINGTPVNPQTWLRQEFPQPVR